jgi:hypothetical protein
LRMVSMYGWTSREKLRLCFFSSVLISAVGIQQIQQIWSAEMEHNSGTESCTDCTTLWTACDIPETNVFVKYTK